MSAEPTLPYRRRGATTTWADKHRPQGYLTPHEYARKYGYPPQHINAWSHNASAGGVYKRLAVVKIGSYRFIKDMPPG